MEHIDTALSFAVKDIFSDGNYDRLFAFYRFWFDIRRAYRQIPTDPIIDDIWPMIRQMNAANSGLWDKLTHPTAHLVLRLASDAESDHALAPHNSGLQSRLSKKTLREFFTNNLRVTNSGGLEYGVEIMGDFYADTSLIAHWANLGYVEEDAIRNHILQSLISHLRLHHHQADALCILFQVAGPTFEAYVETSVVDRCFKLLESHHHIIPGMGQLIQEVIELRGRNWKGLPPPPVFTTRKPKLTHTNEKDPSATPVVISSGLLNRGLEPQAAQPPLFESVTISDTDTVFGSSITQSPSVSIATLSDFTIADASDDETPVDYTAVVPDETFYLEDGNVEVLCGKTLFRAHTSVLSFHSPALRRMFAQASLATADSPNGCPRILSTDTAADFAMLLNVVYLPEFPERNKVPDFATFSSLLRVTAKYEMPTVRSRLLEAVRDAYPEASQGLAPPKLLGEDVFSGPTPHPNEVLNLFLQQELTSALPMAYYMAVRRGLGSLMDRRLPRNAILSLDVLQSAIGGLTALREVELNGTHRLIFGSRPCSDMGCPSGDPTDPMALEAYRKIFNDIVGPSQQGTKALQIPESHEGFIWGIRFNNPYVCSSCVERWELGHTKLREEVWAMLPDAFGLKG